MRKTKERIKLENKVIRAVQHFLAEEDKDDVKFTSSLIDGLGFDSLDIIELTFLLESRLDFNEKEVVWDAFWSNREVTVKDLCDFIENKVNHGVKKER